MPDKTPDSSSNPIDSMRKDLLRTEKKLVDLELAMTEISKFAERMRDVDLSALENLKKMDKEHLDLLVQLPKMRQELEDLQDLILVESAGVQEIKSLMEEINSKMEGQQPAKPEVSQALVPAELQEKLSALDTISSKVIGLEQEVQRLRLQGGASQMMKVEGKDADVLNRSLSTLTSRIDALESVSVSLSDEIKGIRSSFQKIGGLERISGTISEMREKADYFKFVESEVKGVSKRVESFYENIDKRLDKIRDFQREIDDIRKQLDRVGEKSVMQKIEDINRKVAEMDQTFKNLSQKVNSMDFKEVDENFKKLNDAIKESERRAVSETKKRIDVVGIELSDIMSRIVAIETRIGNLENLESTLQKVRPIVLE